MTVTNTIFAGAVGTICDTGTAHQSQRQSVGGGGGCGGTSSSIVTVGRALLANRHSLIEGGKSSPVAQSLVNAVSSSSSRSGKEKQKLLLLEQKER